MDGDRSWPSCHCALAARLNIDRLPRLPYPPSPSWWIACRTLDERWQGCGLVKSACVSLERLGLLPCRQETIWAGLPQHWHCSKLLEFLSRHVAKTIRRLSRQQNICITEQVKSRKRLPEDSRPDRAEHDYSGHARCHNLACSDGEGVRQCSGIVPC